MQLSTLNKILNSNYTGPDHSFKEIRIDSRNVNPAELFVAIVGENQDGHDFIDQAIKNGAIAAIVSKEVNTELPTLLVADTLNALVTIAEYRRSESSAKFTAITGSNGKTTCKEMIASIFSQAGKTYANKGNFNNHIGMPITLANVDKSYDYAVLEMGANHKGEIKYLTSIAKPHIALITQIAPAHLDGFNSIEGVAQAKAEIFLGLENKGVAIINNDDDYAGFLKDKAKPNKIITFGLKNKADITADNIKYNLEQQPSFKLITPKNSITINLPLQGTHNIMNALACTAIAYAADIEINKIKLGLENSEAVNGRLKLIKSKLGYNIIDDSYNANLVSVKAAIDVLSCYTTERILILGDMGELGTKSEQHHSELGVYAKQLGITKLITLGDISIKASEAFGDDARHFTNQQDLITHLHNTIQKDSTYLIKGSRAMQMENIVEFLKAGELT